MIIGKEKLLEDLTKAAKGDEKFVEVFRKKIKPFAPAYQAWHSEAVMLVRQMMPDRLADFVRMYERPKTR